MKLCNWQFINTDFISVASIFLFEVFKWLVSYLCLISISCFPVSLGISREIIDLNFDMLCASGHYYNIVPLIWCRNQDTHSRKVMLEVIELILTNIKAYGWFFWNTLFCIGFVLSETDIYSTSFEVTVSNYYKNVDDLVIFLKNKS